ncbi:hypothetical protein I7I53_04493 [Histoplasma capsulatum var. duboisii H88]|uniref:Uncharacterized protein n=1 Tax=Ajellomyces capsulatus (strain H88) TaxID=544711 RepID=A0A8A1LUR2_AJEC8|nr:hypothetical protein I7I53_04493 [Histoplasma capsulatum var. duboisii H88]
MKTRLLTPLHYLFSFKQAPTTITTAPRAFFFLPLCLNFKVHRHSQQPYNVARYQSHGPCSEL